MCEGKRKRVEDFRRAEPDELGLSGDDVGPEAFAIALAQHAVYTVACDHDVSARQFSCAGYLGVETDVDTERGSALSEDVEHDRACNGVAAAFVLNALTFSIDDDSAPIEGRLGDA